ncbi:MAG: B12-binding domain-containing radical SAM protein [Sedimentisphaerales bacterium]|nr:B12-binding domain-containing radical SAM protein [Sedimentisphaerales bacterium]
MKIVLLYPPIGKITNYNTPTGLLYVGTVLKKNGHDVRLVDCSVEPDYKNILDKEIKDTDILGVYAMSVHIKLLLPELRRLKQINENIKIIWGGPHAILFPEQTAKSPLADIVVKGEGENVMLEIVKGYENGTPDLHNIKGVAFEENGQVFSNPYADYVDLSTIPFLDWSLVKKEVFDVIKNSIIRVQASRGCPYKCAFCINVLTNNRKMRYRPAEKVLDEIEYLYNEYKIKRVAFRDELFMSNRQQVRDIAQGLIDRNIKITWVANPRCEYFNASRIDDDYLKLLADSGCTKLQCGGESGSERILKMLHKQITVEDILNFVRRAKKFNINCLVAFMTGLPTETQEEQLQTMRLIRDILRIQPDAVINGPANYRPYPGGELYEMCVKKYNLSMPESLEDWENAEELGGTRPPWVKNLILNKFLWTSVRAATLKPRYIWEKVNHNPFKTFVILVFSMVSKLRLRYTFYKLPVEFYLLDWYYRFIERRGVDFT